MALTPTEREEHFFKAMVDAADGSTPEELEPTERKEHWYKEIIDAIETGGGGSGGGGVLVVHDVDNTLDKTWQEIYDAMLLGGASISADNPTRVMNVVLVTHDTKHNSFVVAVSLGEGYSASSADGYPELSHL